MELDNKKAGKIRKLFGDKYHLFQSYDLERDEMYWAVYKKADNFKEYMSLDNTAIMTSETHTYEELLNFAKKHHEVDMEHVIVRFGLVTSIIMLILAIVNIFVCNDELKYFLRYGNLMNLIYVMTTGVVVLKNLKVSQLELEEYFEKLGKEFDTEEE